MTNQTEFIYLDNAATTQVSEISIEKILFMMRDNFGNPSSAHSFGLQAEKELTIARKRILSALGYSQKDGDLIFTSGGTEANNLALLGVCEARKRIGNKVLIGNSEHASVQNAGTFLASHGFEIVWLSTKNGKLDLNEIENFADEHVILISSMLVNNETGAIYDISALNDIRKQKCPNAYLHIDAVQGFCKENVSYNQLGVDLISISGHKIHSPKGVGALFVKKGIKLKEQIFGGGQEKNYRSGTEAVPNICAFGVNAEIMYQNIKSNYRHVLSLYNYLKEQIEKKCPDCVLTTPDFFSPYIASIIIPNIRSEIMLRFLSDKGIFVSAGSACSSKSGDNRVLFAYGLDRNKADSTLRISFCEYNTTHEIDRLIYELSNGIKALIPVRYFKNGREN